MFVNGLRGFSSIGRNWVFRRIDVLVGKQERHSQAAIHDMVHPRLQEWNYYRGAGPLKERIRLKLFRNSFLLNGTFPVTDVPICRCYYMTTFYQLPFNIRV